jgi:Glyoxalase/Bleomycin resistance protein/Dioxygenase superfamily
VPLLNFGQPADGIVQLGFVVEDLDAAIGRYTQLLNIGPWTVFENMSLGKVEYRGVPSSLDLTIANGCAGHMQIELIQQNDDRPSVYTEKPLERRYEFHHWGVATRDFDRDFERFRSMGYEVAVYAHVEDFDARGAHMDTTRDLPGMIELIEMTPEVEQVFTDSYKAALGWDGTDPVRVMRP